jgi:hypothetical protein
MVTAVNPFGRSRYENLSFFRNSGSMIAVIVLNSST